MGSKDAALAAEVLAMEAALQTKEAALQARAAAHKAEFAFLLQSNEAAQQARDTVVLSTALFPFSSDAAHRAPFVVLSPDCLTVTRTSGDTLAWARSERSRLSPWMRHSEVGGKAQYCRNTEKCSPCQPHILYKLVARPKRRDARASGGSSFRHGHDWISSRRHAVPSRSPLE